MVAFRQSLVNLTRNVTKHTMTTIRLQPSMYLKRGIFTPAFNNTMIRPSTLSRPFLASQQQQGKKERSFFFILLVIKYRSIRRV